MNNPNPSSINLKELSDDVDVAEEKKPLPRQDAPESNMATRGLDWMINGAIALIFFLVPVFFTGQAAQGIGFDKMIIFYFLALLAIVAWATKGVVRGELSIKRTPLDMPIVGLLILLAASTVFSVNVKDSFIGAYGNPAKGLISAIIIIMFFYLLVSNLDVKRIKLYFWSLVASASVIVIYSLFQLFGIFILPFDFARSNSFNPLGSLSALTMFLVFAFPLFMVAMAQIKEIFPRISTGFALALKIILGLISLGALAILALLNGFTFWPVMIVGLVIVLMFFFSKIISISSNNLILPIASFILSIILLVLGNFNIVNLNLPVEVNLSRSSSWQITKQSLKHDPIFGSGPSTFYYDFSKYKGQEFNSSPLWNVRFDNPSGVLFDLLATAGVLGTLAVILIVLISLSVIFISLTKARNKEIDSIFLAFVSGFVCILIFSVLFAFNSALILVALLFLVLTIAIAVTVYPGQFKSLRLSFRASAKYSLALAAIFLSITAGVCFLFAVGFKMFMADIYAQRAMVSQDVNAKINYLNKAIEWADYQDTYYLSAANNYMSLANQEALGNKNQEVIQNNLSLAIETGKKGVDLAPNRASNNELLALIYENASFYTRGALEWADTYYNKVIDLEPDNPTPYLRMALINMARSNAETDKAEKEIYINDAIKKYGQALEKKSDFAAAYYGQAIAEEKLAKLDDAIEQLKKAVLLARDNVDYRFELGRLYFNRGVINPSLSQNSAADIAKGQANDSSLSVQPHKTDGSFNGRNDDLNTSEQIFLSLVQANPNHANAWYSLAMLYQKVGETENARKAVAQLLTVVQDDPTKEAVKSQFPGLY